MNRVDVVLLVLLLPFALRGYSRGFLREGFGVLGVAAAAFGTALAWERVAAFLVAQQWLSLPLASIVAVAAVFFAVYVLFQILGLGADRMARAVLLGGLNRAVGVAFGMAKGAAILGFLLVLVLRFASPALRDRIRASALGDPLVKLATVVVDAGRQMLPPNVAPERQHI